MLYYIVPPIIIVIGVSVLVFFLFKKAQQVPSQELVEAQRQAQLREKKMGLIMSALGQFGLKLMERIMHRSKLLSLKLHNMSNEWFHSIREKRQMKMQQMQLEKQKRIESLESVEMTAEEIQIEPERERVMPPVQPSIKRPVVKPATDITAQPVRSFGRLVGNKNRAQQEPKVQLKDQMEEALIKRIAINPRDIEAYERLGDYYMESMNYRDALECFRQVLRLSPAHHKAKLRIRRLERLVK